METTNGIVCYNNNYKWSHQVSFHKWSSNIQEHEEVPNHSIIIQINICQILWKNYIGIDSLSWRIHKLLLGVSHGV